MLFVSFSIGRSHAQACKTDEKKGWKSHAKKEIVAYQKGKSHPGIAVYKANCAPCHGIKETVLGPPLAQGAQLYAGNAAGLVAYLKNPVRKRRGGAQMPPQTHLTSRQLSDVANWILTLK